MKAKLVVVGGDAKAAEITLKLPTVIGRGRGSRLVLPHPLVSRRHCEIFESAGQLMVRDLGSLNGTFIGNERVEENGQAVLPPGELLTIGAVTFRAAYGEENGEAAADFDAVQSRAAPGARTVRAEPPGTVRVQTNNAAIDTEREGSDESVAGGDVEFAKFDNEVLDEDDADDDGDYDGESTDLLDLDGEAGLRDGDETQPAPQPPRQPPPIAPPRTESDPPATDSDDNELSSFLDGLR